MGPEREDYAVKEARKMKLALPEQDKLLSEQNELVNLVLDRLEVILTPTPPEVATKDLGDRAEEPVRSYVGNELNENNRRIRRTNNKLSDILSRLEV